MSYIDKPLSRKHRLDFRFASIAIRDFSNVFLGFDEIAYIGKEVYNIFGELLYRLTSKITTSMFGKIALFIKSKYI